MIMLIIGLIGRALIMVSTAITVFSDGTRIERALWIILCVLLLDSCTRLVESYIARLKEKV